MAAPTAVELRNQLRELRDTSGLIAVKTGTEVEDMSFADIGILRELTRGIVPLFVKIGGPEARNDLRELLRLGVDGVIAPMIESAYALQKFIWTMREIFGEHYAQTVRGINIETITAFRCMEDILSVPEAADLQRVTAARSDLSGSMGLEPDHPDVLAIAARIVALARARGLSTSMGGSLHPGIIRQALIEVAPDSVNTRHMAVDCELLRAGAAQQLILKHLGFEADLCDFLAGSGGPLASAYQKRSTVIRARMQADQACRAEKATARSLKK